MSTTTGLTHGVSSMTAVYKTIYNNQTEMEEVFRKQNNREGYLKEHLIKAHRSFGNEIFKLRNK